MSSSPGHDPAPGPALEGRTEEVREGAGGRLFLERAPGFDARRLHGRVHDMAEPELERLWGRPLDRLAALAVEIGARLVLMIPPDAHGVHPEALPRGLAYAEPSIGDAVAGLARTRGVTVVASRSALRASRGAVDVFRRTDSHWSGFGAYIAYRELMAAVPELGAAVVASDDVEYEWRWEAGDLGAGLDPPRRAPVASARLLKARARTVFEALDAQRHALKITEHPDRSLPSAVMFRDSYASEIAPYLAESFRRLALVGAGSLIFEDLIREEQPQLILIERAERCLPFGLAESDGFGDWREVWPQGGETAREPEAREQELRAGRALLVGKGAEAVDAAEAASLLSPSADRSARLGRALEAAGRPGAGDAFQAASLQAPERFAFAMRLGNARMREGREEEARAAFSRACALRPWSGVAYEHLGYAAMRLRDGELARYALERACAVAPHRPGAWVWRAELLAAAGELAAALRMLEHGLHASPDDPALRAACARLSGAA